jgi:endonuclease/exonuclease/phosphatase family metal-dependent hydrolase
MRLATLNLESLDLPPRSEVALETRAAVLRPVLERLAGDVLCLQEVNAQRVPGTKARQLVALDRLLEGTRYASYHRAFTGYGEGRSATDVHNLVTLSRFPITEQREIRHDHVEPEKHAMLSGEHRGVRPVEFERPLLLTRIETQHAGSLWVINLHLRAPLASAIPGEKSGPFSWRSMRGWAEGYYLSALKRCGQALELRLLIDEVLRSAPGALVAAAGDFNAEDHETPLRLAIGAIEDTGATALAAESMVVLDRALPSDRRWTVLHAGRPQMLDHILVSRALYGRFRSIEVHNEAIGDEVVAYSKSIEAAGSYHAGLVADLDL